MLGKKKREKQLNEGGGERRKLKKWKRLVATKDETYSLTQVSKERNAWNRDNEEKINSAEGKKTKSKKKLKKVMV